MTKAGQKQPVGFPDPRFGHFITMPVRSAHSFSHALEFELCLGDFQTMIRSKTATRLEEWMRVAKLSLVNSIANAVEKGFAAVRNAIISPWSNGRTEGQTTRLKLVKRQMYGRARRDLLQVRLIGGR